MPGCFLSLYESFICAFVWMNFKVVIIKIGTLWYQKEITDAETYYVLRFIIYTGKATVYSSSIISQILRAGDISIGRQFAVSGGRSLEGQILGSEGAGAKTLGILYKAVVWSMILFRLETWVVTPHDGRTVGGVTIG